MEINFLKNENGDVLSPERTSEGRVLFRVIAADALRFKDIYFLAETEDLPNPPYGRKTHLKGGDAWEKTGRYFKGQKAAFAAFEGAGGADYYTNKIQ